MPAGSAIIWHGNTWHGSFPRTIPGLRINLSMYFCRQNIQPQENYKDHAPEEVLQRYSDTPRFATLIGSKTPTTAGPTKDRTCWDCCAEATLEEPGTHRNAGSCYRALSAL